MRRTRNAVVAAGFTYAQLGLAVLAGAVLTPIVLGTLGARTYGVWLATVELLGYGALLDLGVVAIVPWLVAQADGRRDPAGLRAVLARACTIAAAAGAGLALATLVAWHAIPRLLGLDDADFARLAGPLALAAGVLALAYPLRVFSAALIGLQDVTFSGSLAIVQTAGTVALTTGLLAAGHGLYAVAIGIAVPPVVTGLGSAVRLWAIRSSALRHWPAPDVAGMRWMLLEGGGAWVAGLGWSMAAASSGIVIAFLGNPEAVVVYACTAKLAQALFHGARILPDSGLVGLAQADGERSRRRVRGAVTTILRSHLLLAGAAATAALALNPLVVRLWVGREVFGGTLLDAVVTGALLFVALAHGPLCCAAVLGRRRAVGAVTLAYGVVTLMLAVGLGRTLGLPGVALAPVGAGLVTTLPAGVLLLRGVLGVSWRRLYCDVARPWAFRLVPFLAVLVAVRESTDAAALDVVPALAAAALGMTAYVWWMRPLCQRLPLHPALSDWLCRWRLIPATAGALGEAKPWR